MSPYFLEISTLLLGLVSAAVGISLLRSIDMHHVGDMKRHLDGITEADSKSDHRVTVDGRVIDLDDMSEGDIDRIKRKLATG